MLPELLGASIWRLLGSQNRHRSGPEVIWKRIAFYMMLRYPDTLGRDPEGRVAHFSLQQGAGAHKTLNLLQSAIGVFKIEGRVSQGPLYSWKAGSIRRSTTTPVTVGARWRIK